MPVEPQLVIWWVLFGGTHVLGSAPPVRARLIRTLGLRGFKAVYSLVALATFAPLITIAWQNRHEGALIYDPPGWTVHVTEVLMLVAFLFLAQAFATPSPSSTVMEMSGRAVTRPRGIQRVTRHPSNFAFFLFGIAHMISNPTVGDWIFWGGWPVFALVSAIHQDHRSLTAGPTGFTDFYRQTSLVPFGAVLAGRQQPVLSELSWIGLLGGAGAFAVVRLLHPHLIGGFA